MSSKVAVFWPGDYRAKPNELALSYVEEATVQLEKALQKLGRSSYRVEGWLTKPHDFVDTACNLLLELLDFEWIAVSYSLSRPPGPESASLVVAGALPCPRSDFEAKVAGLFRETPGDARRMLHECPDSELARLVGSQVVVDAVKTGAVVTGFLLAGSKIAEDPEEAAWPTDET